MLKSQGWRADRHSKSKPRPKRSPGPTISLFRHHTGPTAMRRGPPMKFRLLAVVFIVAFYLLYIAVHSSHTERKGRRIEPVKIQASNCCNATLEKSGEIRGAMILAFSTYRRRAWGSDDVLAIDGGAQNKRNGWGAFIAEAATTLAVMELWEDVRQSVSHLLSIDFRDSTTGLIDPAATSETYLGAYLSLASMVEGGVIPGTVIDDDKQLELLKRAETLSELLAKAYKTPSGLPSSTLDMKTGQVAQRGLITPSRIAAGVLEAMMISAYSVVQVFVGPVAKAWSIMTLQKSETPIPGLIAGSWNINDGSPFRSEARWDKHYETLLNSIILDPADTIITKGETPEKHLWPWRQAVQAVRWNLASRSQHTEKAPMQHLFMGSYDGTWYKNEMELSDCSVAGNIILGAAYSNLNHFLPLGKALLEGCTYMWEVTPSKLPPKSIAWEPSLAYRFNTSFVSQSDRQKRELTDYGFWVTEANFKIEHAVGYAQSLFFAYRITGEERYREATWKFYQSIKRLWMKNGYAGLVDVMAPSSEASKLDESDSRGVANILMYLWLTFSNGEKGSLDKWAYSSGGHPFRNGL